MLAVVKSGGKQYIIREGDEILVEKLNGKKGGKVSFPVLLVRDKKGQVTIGAPLLPRAKVQGTILEQKKGEKVVVFKMKSKKRYRRKAGHRQELTKVKIEKISG